MKLPTLPNDLSDDVKKTQVIRLADVFFIGPLMIYAGARGKFSLWIDTALLITGILTISYNADNYIRNRSAQ